MDPHKRSVTIEVMTADETILGGGRFGTDRRRVTPRCWRYVSARGRTGSGRSRAATGSAGTSRIRLLADGEQVVDVPPKLSARARVFATGQGRKTDATDAHSVALVGTRMAGLRPVVDDEQLAVLRLLVDRRRSLGEDHTRMIAQLHRLLLELIPGGAKKDLSAAQAKALLAKVRPRDAAGKTRRRVAAELVGRPRADLRRARRPPTRSSRQLVAATGTTLMDLHGIGPSGAARLLVEVGDITRFPDRDHFASWNGTAPDRRLLRRPGPAPAVPGREPADQPGAAHHGHRPAPQPHRRPRLLRPRRRPPARPRWKPCAPQTPAVRHRLPHHARRRVTAHRHARGRAREGNGATTLTPARPAHIPTPALRTSHFPDPPPPSLERRSRPRLDTEGSHERTAATDEGAYQVPSSEALAAVEHDGRVVGGGARRREYAAPWLPEQEVFPVAPRRRRPRWGGSWRGRAGAPVRGRP